MQQLCLDYIVVADVKLSVDTHTEKRLRFVVLVEAKVGLSVVPGRTQYFPFQPVLELRADLGKDNQEWESGPILVHKT